MSEVLKQREIILGLIALFVATIGLHFPASFFQNQRKLIECDALCYGYYQSFQSGVQVVGAVLIGQFSDHFDRLSALYIGIVASLLSCVIGMSDNSIASLYLAQIPYGLDHNHATMNALFADYANSNTFSETERASALGALGMVAGLAFMFGPVIGAVAFSSYAEAKAGACVMLLIGGGLMYKLPKVASTKAATTADITLKSRPGIVHGFLLLFSAQTPGARLLLAMRFCMGLAFSMYKGVFMASLHERFSFSPLQYGLLLGWLGLCYALSQGIIARPCIKLFRCDTKLVMCCILVMGLGRTIQMITPSLLGLYVVIFVVVTALGVMYTVMTTACSMIADSHSVGTLFGSMDAAEKLAGLFGPVIGGYLVQKNKRLPLVADVLIFALLFVLVRFQYRASVVSQQLKKAQ